MCEKGECIILIYKKFIRALQIIYVKIIYVRYVHSRFSDASRVD